ncbi:MAG: bifunctional hydroxymethylpyrimidine kinase/phosphomethylpyrimidine kinase [Lactobacillaceae bacterium]|jgi:hydroxymethylpyrimidine/phosphomethylpyrimidine kinase|nr:bifunctional hydroxymethylpyrimidine kinase/phosphomethylpyrimidine kinase [Lactobacillaceae bacterium]
MTNEFPQVVTIAGTDSDGSAGVPADLISFFATGVHGMAILTAAVAGNSYGIHQAHHVPVGFINNQFDALASDFHIKAAKTGMLTDATVIHTVVENLKKVDFGYLVVDPVISTKHGAMLLELDAVDFLKRELIPIADVITPNFYEAEILADCKIMTASNQIAAARRIQQLGAKNVLIKGAHAVGSDQVEVKDYVLLEDGTGLWLSGTYVDTEHINGTGDTLSAIITAELAKGATVLAAIQRAKELTLAAIQNEIAVGHKFGPINHWELL